MGMSMVGDFILLQKNVDPSDWVMNGGSCKTVRFHGSWMILLLRE